MAAKNPTKKKGGATEKGSTVQGAKHLTKFDYGLICDWLEIDDNVEKIDGTEKKTKIGARPPVRAKAYELLANYVNEHQRKGSNLAEIEGKSMKHRWRNYWTRFRDAKIMSMQTGFGITDADLAAGIETVEDKLEQECPYFKRLDKVLGTRPSILAYVKFQTGFKNLTQEQQDELPEGVGKFDWKGGKDNGSGDLSAPSRGEQLLAGGEDCDEDWLGEKNNLSPSHPGTPHNDAQHRSAASGPSVLHPTVDKASTIPRAPILGAGTSPVAAVRTPLGTPSDCGDREVLEEMGDVDGLQQQQPVDGGEAHATGGQAQNLPREERINSARPSRAEPESGHNEHGGEQVLPPTGRRLSRSRSASVGNDKPYPNKKQVGDTRHSINSAFADNLEAVNLQREKTNDLRAQKMELDRQFAERRLDWDKLQSQSQENVESRKLEWEKKRFLEEKKQRIADRKLAREDREANQKMQMKIALISSGIAKSVDEVKGLLDLLE